MSKYIFYSFNFFVLIILICSFRSNDRNIKFYHHNFPTGLTVGGFAGAPGDQETCNNCHAGTSGTITPNSNANSLTLWLDGVEVDEYIPGETYTVKLRLIANPNVKGFQATVCAGSERVGEFTTDGSNTVNTSSDVVASHANNTGISEWSWNWTAPNIDKGQVIFYASTIHFTNGSGQINQSQHPFNSSQSLGVHYIKKSDFISTYCDEKLQSLIVDINDLKFEQGKIELYEISGQKAGELKINDTYQKLYIPTINLKKGIYILNFYFDDKMIAQKIFLNTSH